MRMMASTYTNFISACCRIDDDRDRIFSASYWNNVVDASIHKYTALMLLVHRGVSRTS
jgi:hypothetical protein